MYSGEIVHKLGLHGLSCTKNTGCFPRHSIQLTIIFSEDHSPHKSGDLGRPLTWQEMGGGLMAWLWVPGMGYKSCAHFCSVPLKRQCQTGRHCTNRGGKIPKI